MMIVDAHTHIVPPEVLRSREALAERDEWFRLLYENPRARLATAEDLVAAMDDAGVDCAVSFGFAFCDQGLCDLCNAYVLDAARRYAGRIIPFAVTSPCDGAQALAATERALAAGACGVGELFSDGQRFSLSGEGDLAPLLALAREADCPVMLHVSEPVGHEYPGKGLQGPAEAYRLALAHPDNRLILAHWGGGLPFYELMPEVQRALQNVYYDSAASTYLYDDAVYRAVTTWAPARALFGSDYPLLTPRRLLNRVRRADLAQKALARFLGGNAAALLGLDRRPTEGGHA